MGSLRRRIEIVTRADGVGGGEARGVVEDDMHHFLVTIRAVDGRVSDTATEAPRFPNVLCPAAGDRVRELIGMRLVEASAAVMEHTDARQQCTHQFDLASLLVAALARGIAHRVYEAEIPDLVDDRRHVRLWRDGALVLEWDMAGATIEGPAPYAGRPIGTGFTGWVREALDLETAEAALVLRRAVFISSGRAIDLDDPSRRVGTGPMGGCWVWQPQRAAFAHRVVGSMQDFTDRPEALTADDQAWLGFRA